MEGIHHITEYSKGFITYQLHPITTGHVLFIIAYSIFSIYFYKYLFQYSLFKWMYLGSIIILISSIYGDGIGSQSSLPNFKIGRNRE